MSIDAGVCLIKQPDRNAGKRTRMSAGTWMGEEKDCDRGLVVVEAVLTGKAPFAGFPGMAPSVSEPVLAMCLRAAAALPAMARFRSALRADLIRLPSLPMIASSSA